MTLFNGFPRAVPDFGGGVNIKSIQQGITNIDSGSSATITISPVDLSKAIIIVYPSVSSAAYSPNFLQFKADFISEKQFTLTRGVSSSGSTYVRYAVVEFSGAKSIQKGSFTLVESSASGTVTISPVKPNKSMIYYSFSSDHPNSSNGLPPGLLSGVVFNSTQIVFEHAAYLGSKNISWFLVEYP